jgi:glycosyltransferase involved in cell wall biosynthesis
MPDRHLPITVIVPVYNDERYLGHALASLKAQTRPPAEILLVDNASTDRSVEVAESQRLPNLRIIRNAENLGATRARNIALDQMSQPLAMFLDSDDFLSPEALEAGYEQLTSTGAEISLFRMARTDLFGDVILFRLEPPAAPISGTDALRLTVPEWRIDARGVYSRDLLDRARTKFTPHGFSDDELLARLSLAEAATVAGNHGTYHYRDNRKIYTFAKVVGQTLTNIHSTALARDLLGASDPGARGMRNTVVRNLAGLLARAARGEGDPSHVAELHRQLQALRIGWTAGDLRFRLMNQAVGLGVGLATRAGR